MNIEFPVTLKKGDCYKSSLESAKELQALKDLCETDSSAECSSVYQYWMLHHEIKIRHGWLTSINGNNAGRRLHHAWIEVGDTVIETQNGQKEKYGKQRYYTHYKAYPNEEYSITDAENLKIEQNKYGAWRGEGKDECTVCGKIVALGPVHSNGMCDI